MNAITLTTKQARPIVKLTFPNYHGRKFKLEFTDRITFYDTNWSGGTKNEYRFVHVTGKVVALHAPAPWTTPIEGKMVELPANVLVVVRQYFCGMEVGISIYANPSWSPKWLEGATVDKRSILREI
jgi:hypothetical protein